MSEISLSKLVNKTITNKLSIKLFISLYHQLMERRKIEDNEFLDSLESSDELAINLFVNLSFHSIEYNRLFWRNFIKLTTSCQTLYLKNIARNLSLDRKNSRIDKEVLNNFVNVQFVDFVNTYSNHKKSAQLEAFEFISLSVGIIVDHYENIIENMSDFQDMLVNLITNLKSFEYSNRVITYLLLKSETILDDLRLSQLSDSQFNTHSIVAKTSRSGESVNSINSNNLTLNLSNNQRDFYIRIREIWLYQCMKTSENLDDVDKFTRLFIANVIPENQKKNSSFIISELITGCFEISKLPGSQFFNVKNFIVITLPEIIKHNLKYDDRDTLLDSIEDDLDETVDHELKKEFLSRLSDISEESELNVKEKLNQKLLNVNSEFTSLEESGLIELTHDLYKKARTYKLQKEFAKAVLDTVESLIIEKNCENLSYFLLSLLSQAEIIGSVIFHDKFSLLFKLIDFIDQEKFKISDDDENFQDFYSQFGVILLSAIFIIEKFDFKDIAQIHLKGSFVLDYVNNFYFRLNDNLTNNIKELDEESELIVSNYDNLLRDWIDLLFNDSNDGLSDDLIKSLSIKQIYKLIPQIYKQGIIAKNLNKIDESVLNNGLDYLSQNFLLPTTVSILSWLVRDPSISPDCKTKIMSDLLKSNLNESNESSNFVFKVIVDILGDRLYDFQFDSEVQQLIEKRVIRQEKLSIEQDTNLIESFRLSILEGKDLNYIFFQFLHNNKVIILRDLIQEVYDFQETNKESSKLYINLLVFVILNDSIKSESDKKYWMKQIKIASPIKMEECSNVDQEFTLSMDYHYSSIFNDDSSQPSKAEVEDIDQFLRNDDDMELDDDLFNDSNNRKKTSEELANNFKAMHNEKNLLQQFNNLKKDVTENNLFYKSIDLLSNKIYESLNDWSI